MYAVVARQREDVMVVDESGVLDNVSCKASAKGNVKSGMDCIWTPIPHLCLSQSQQVGVVVVCRMLLCLHPCMLVNGASSRES